MAENSTNHFAGAIGRHLTYGSDDVQKDSPAPRPETTVALPAPGSPRGLARILTLHNRNENPK